MKSFFDRILLAGQVLQSGFISRILGANAYAIIVRSPQGLFAVDPRDRGVGRQLLLHGAYGVRELDRLQGHMRRQGRVLVVGAHIGSIAIPLARHCSELMAVEPNPSSNRLLRLNLRLNDITNCTVIDLAASDHSGSIDMLTNTANSGGAKRVPKREDAAYRYDKPESVQVPCAPLDEVLAEHRFDLIVMDIEGSEYFALRGMRKVLGASEALAIEFVPHHLRNVSAVGVEEFLAPISPHFSRLFIPSKSISLGRRDFLPTLQKMFERDEGDEGLVFTR
jgi:FkbM family methyltransferase